MRAILYITIFILGISEGYSQSNLDSLNDKGIELYIDGKETAALKCWKKILKPEPDSTRAYGMAANNILFKYFEDGNIAKTKKYYNLIINSNLNDSDKNSDLMNPYANYRHHATMRMASLYGKNKDFYQALHYVYLADTLYEFVTFSLTSFIYNKVDMAFWKFRLYRDLNNIEMAKFVMIERGLNNDYIGQFPNWASASSGNDEVELAETLFEQYNKDQLKELKAQMDSSFMEIKIKSVNEKQFAIFDLNEMTYRIPIYSEIDPMECAKKFKSSVLYVKLEELISK